MSEDVKMVKTLVCCATIGMHIVRAESVEGDHDHGGIGLKLELGKSNDKLKVGDAVAIYGPDGSLVASALLSQAPDVRDAIAELAAAVFRMMERHRGEPERARTIPRTDGVVH